MRFFHNIKNTNIVNAFNTADAGSYRIETETV